MNRLLFLLIAACFAGGLTAQTKIQLRVDSLVIEDAADEVCVPVIVDSMPPIATTMEFSIAWDTSELDFSRVDFGENPVGFARTDVAQAIRLPNSVNVIYIDPLAQAFVIAPNTTIFQVCFSTLEKESSAGVISFGGEKLPEFGDTTLTGNGPQLLPFDTIPGFLQYSRSPVSVFTPTVQEPEWASRLSIYPNPYVSGPLTIAGDQLPSFNAVTVYNIEGKQIQNYQGNARRLNFSDLPAGEYAIKISADGQQVSRTVIKR